MILLDTNVVSELIRPDPDPKVEAWLAEQYFANVFLSVISEAELRYGVAILPAGIRRDRLADEIDGMLREDFAGRILTFDSECARAYALNQTLQGTPRADPHHWRVGRCLAQAPLGSVPH